MIFWLAISSLTSWFASTLAGGGSPLILIPVTAMFIDAAAIPPVITIGMLLGNSQRSFLYWSKIDWSLMWWFLPGGITGAVLGAFALTKTRLEWLSLVLGLFLIISALSYIFGGNKQKYVVPAWYFLPGGFIYGVLSGLVGSVGPLLNTAYLNYGLEKEEMVATKSIHMVMIHVVKMIAYVAFGTIHSSDWVYGLILGIAAFPGNWLGQMVLYKMSQQQFKQIVVGFVVVSGMLILWEQRTLLMF